MSHKFLTKARTDRDGRRSHLAVREIAPGAGFLGLADVVARGFPGPIELCL